MKRKPYNKNRIEDGIRKYAGKRTCKEIASILFVTPGTISKYACEMMVSLQTEKYKRIVKAKRKRMNQSNGFFNVKQHPNWIV